MSAATKLVFTTQPAGYTPESLLATMPVLAAQDNSNVTDATFTGQVALSLPAGSKGKFIFLTEPIRSTHTIQAGSTASQLIVSPALPFPDRLGSADYTGKGFTASVTRAADGSRRESLIASNTGSNTLNLAAPLSVTPVAGDTLVIYSGVVFDTVYVTAVAGLMSPNDIALMGYGPLQIQATYAGLTSATSNAMNSTGTYAVDGLGVQYPAELPRTTPTKAQLGAFAATYVETAATIASRIASIRAIGGGGNYKIRLADGELLQTTQGAGQIVVPAHTNGSTGWLQIESATLPTTFGTRVHPADFSTQAIFETLDNQPCIRLADASNNVRLVGLHIRRSPSSVVSSISALVNFGEGDTQTSHSQFSTGCKMERCYVHGLPGVATRAAVRANADDIAIFDNYIAEIHEVQADAQAVVGTNGGTGLLLENNYLESAGEPFLFGGSDPALIGGVPSDITIRKNHSAIPLAWKTDPAPKPDAWSSKNLGELKSARRVLIEGNVFEHMFVGAQDGTAIQFTTVNQSGTASHSGVRDAIFRYNVVHTAGGGASFSANNSSRLGGAVTLQRVALYHNVFDNIARNDTVDDAGRMFLFGGGLIDVTIDHLTMRRASGSPSECRAMTFSLAPTVRFRCTNNLLPGFSNYAIWGDTGGGSTALAHHAPDGTFSHNVVSEVPSAYLSDYPVWPAADYPTTVAGVGYTTPASSVDWNTVNPATLLADLALTAGSTYSATGSKPALDGLAIGADMAAIATATSGAWQPSEITGSTGGSVATQLLLSTPPAGALAGQPLPQQPVIAFADAGGSTVTSETTSVTASLVVTSGSVTPTGTLTKAAVSGLATFTDLGFTGTLGSVAHWRYTAGAFVVDGPSFTVLTSLAPAQL